MKLNRNLILSLLALLVLAVSAFAEAQTTIDPLDIGIGTRSLGMGRAFIAQADDTSSLFLNPAGLAYTNDWGVTSMYTSLLSEVTCTTIGVHRATSNEAMGFGYVGATLGGDLYLTYRDPVTSKITPINTVPVGYTSRLMLFSYGFIMDKYMAFPSSDKLAFGISLKLFNQDLQGTNESFSASGYNMDIGLSYKLQKWLSLGIYGQNLLPAGAGGVLRWDTGAEESIPGNLKIGLSMKCLGTDGYFEHPQDVYVNLDLENSFISGRPTPYHIGIEWWPYSYLAFRTGIDQDVYSKVSGNGVDNNLTFGLGLKQDIWAFDYAYHQYGPLSSNDTHYFSISYNNTALPSFAPSPEPEPLKKEEEERISIIQPLDKSIIYSETVAVSGEVLSDNIKKIAIDGNYVDVPVAGKGKRTFSADTDIPVIGKNGIKVICYDDNERVICEETVRIIRLPVFKDVKATYWAGDKISLLAALRVFGGYPDGTFKPEKKITRAELTALLVKAKGYSSTEAANLGFSDVKKDFWASYFIKKGVELGYVAGYPDGTFKPNKVVNRAEGAIILSRFAELRELPTIPGGPYPDVPGRHWAAKAIEAAKTAGMLLYLGEKPFQPSKELTRAEVAEMLSQTPLIKEKRSELFDWQVGF